MSEYQQDVPTLVALARKYQRSKLHSKRHGYALHHVNYAENMRAMCMARARELKRRAATLTPRELEMLALLQRARDYLEDTSQARHDLQTAIDNFIRRITT